MGRVWREGASLRHVADVDGVAYDPTVAARALTYVRPYLVQLAQALALTVVVAGASLAGPYLVKVAIDEHIAVGDLPGLTAVLLLALAAYLAQFLATARQVMLVSVVGQSMLRTLREQVFTRLQRLPLAYYDRNKSGVIVSRVINDVSVMNDLLTNGLMNLFTDMLTLVSMVVLMLVLSPRLALATFAVMPLMAFSVWVFTQRAKGAYRLTRQKMGAVTADFQEAIDGARVVQAFAREGISQSRFDRLNDENREANVKANTLSSMLMPVVEFTSAAATVAVISYGGSLVMAGEVTLGVLVAFLVYVSRFFQPIRELMQFYNQLQAAMAGGERVFELLDEPLTLTERPDPLHLEVVRGEIEFRNVWFAYGREPVLKDVSLRAEPGQTIALVGHTGAGKTTIASLLARLYDPTQGTVLLDGHDVRDLTFATLRKHVGIVLQDNFLFSGSIADNIRYGRPEASDAEVVRAATIANAHSVITRFPKGYDTRVMERAANLSLGQRQLLAIARAVLADPRVLILDEATSSVDPRTERLLQEALRSLLKGRTCLVIAHRLSTVRSADQVLVVDEGRIVERGSHEELLRQGGLYRKLYNAWALRADVAPSRIAVSDEPATDAFVSG